MEEKVNCSGSELSEITRLYNTLCTEIEDSLHNDDEQTIRNLIHNAIYSDNIKRDVFGFNPLLHALQTSLLAVEEIGLRREAVIAIIIDTCSVDKDIDLKAIESDFGQQVVQIIQGLHKVRDLYKKTPTVESENFRNLLLSFADDMRVILIMIADRVNVMRQIRDTQNLEAQRKVAEEASYLYAPLAHKLGLYLLKSELEDLSLKYLEHDAYYMIKDNLNATKRSRDEYIESFISPIKAKLENIGLKFHIKGRTKSIHSIWQKMKKQRYGFNGIYDLFAIRIIIDAPLEQEKMQCWQVYSLITDMYQPNPKRLRDWLSVPKSNGYESLHITVLGPQNKWVEVQIRTERMDEIAEHGLAAHWRYKGVKSSNNNLDSWLADIRQALEAGDNLQAMDHFKRELNADEVYVFTPKGDLYKLAKGATVLDFAYHIHSAVGSHCVGARINNKNVSMREILHSGDQVEILTQSNQTPKKEWLNYVGTSRAKSKIRLALKETQAKEGIFAKELLARRLKNRKIDFDESVMSHVIKKLGYKIVSDFYMNVADEKLDVNEVIEKYIEVRDYDMKLNAPAATRSAEEFVFENPIDLKNTANDILVIDQNLKDVDYSLAKCCNPIYGDKVFGFVTVSGGIKIHRNDCPNASELRKRFGYRIVKARWSGKGQSQYSITLRVIGNDDLGIVNNITSIISKDEKIIIRSINIDSHDGLFSGNIEVMVEDTSRMEALMKKLRSVKGIKQVIRL